MVQKVNIGGLNWEAIGNFKLILNPVLPGYLSLGHLFGVFMGTLPTPKACHFIFSKKT